MPYIRREQSMNRKQTGPRKFRRMRGLTTKTCRSVLKRSMGLRHYRLFFLLPFVVFLFAVLLLSNSGLGDVLPGAS